ncbi:MAG: hypothetical protein E7371_04160 [Clostridiales bacterium]|nr:hypothetical protein [Clostridiales bacterium]
MENMEELQESKLESLKQKANAFFERNFALIFAPLLVACLYIVGLVAYSVEPFGDKYTAASYDLSAQICPFIEHLFDVLQGKSSLTYSYAIVGGADVTGTFLYFFVSPFSFLFLVFGDGKVAHASSIVMIFKLASIAFAGTWFAQKQFKHIPEYICIAIGAVYAYCGYMFVANTYINWMDFLIYMPFCAAAFVHFVKTGKFLWFSIMVACCIYTCFSIACFSLFIVFPALIAYALICVEKEDRKLFITRFCLSLAVALFISLPILLPALGAFMRSARGGSLFENVWYGFSVSSEGSIGDFNSSTFIEKYSESLYRKWSYIVADSVFLALTVFWFIRTGLKDKFARFMLVAAVLTLLPLVVDESMNLLNMGSYMSYALRFGFLNALYFLGGACLAIDGWCYDKGCAYDGKPLYTDFLQLPVISSVEDEEEAETEFLPIASTINQKKKKVSYICMGVLVALALAAMAIICFVAYKGCEKLFWSWFIKDEELLKELDGFSARLAHSLGGIEVIVIPFTFVAILVIVGCVLVACRKISPRFLSYILIGVVATQLVFYNSHLIAGNASTQHVNIGHYQDICAVLNEQDDSYFRVKDHDDKLTACVPFTGNSNSFSVFSSVIDKDNYGTYQIFGYLGNGKNSFKSGHNKNKYNRSDEFGDAFLGYKYFIKYVNPNNKEDTVEEQLASFERSKTYVKPVMEVDKDGKEVHLHRGNFYVYENTIVFPLGFRVQGGEGYAFEVDNISNSSNRRINQAALYKYLRGENLKAFTNSDYVTPKSATELSQYLWDKAADVEVGAGQLKAKVTAKAGENLMLSFVASKGYTVTVNGKAVEPVENDLKLLLIPLEEGENEVVCTYSSPYVKYAAVGFGGGVIALLLVWLILKKTKLVYTLSGVISWAGILLAVGVVAFFMLYPTCVFAVKLVTWLV